MGNETSRMDPSIRDEQGLPRLGRVNEYCNRESGHTGKCAGAVFGILALIGVGIFVAWFCILGLFVVSSKLDKRRRKARQKTEVRRVVQVTTGNYERNRERERRLRREGVAGMV